MNFIFGTKIACKGGVRFEAAGVFCLSASKIFKCRFISLFLTRRNIFRAIVLMLLPLSLSAESIPAMNIIEVSDDGTEYSLTLQLLMLMTVLSLLPSILILMTSFTRIIIVLSLLRQALGTAQTPPNQVLVGIALFLSLFVMKPILDEIYEVSFVPVQDGAISFEQGLELARAPLQEFMVSQTREKDILMFMEMADEEPVDSLAEIPLTVLMPAFITSEAKDGFYDRIPHLYTVHHNRSRCRECAHVNGYDDAFANDDLVTV